MYEKILMVNIILYHIYISQYNHLYSLPYFTKVWKMSLSSLKNPIIHLWSAAVVTEYYFLALDKHEWKAECIIVFMLSGVVKYISFNTIVHNEIIYVETDILPP